jgi:hypothetical protein
VLTLLVETVVDVLDEVVLLFDQALFERESIARTRLTEELANAPARGDRQALLDEILAIAFDLGIPDAEVGGWCGTRSGWNTCARRGLLARTPSPRSRAPAHCAGKRKNSIFSNTKPTTVRLLAKHNPRISARTTRAWYSKRSTAPRDRAPERLPLLIMFESVE